MRAHILYLLVGLVLCACGERESDPDTTPPAADHGATAAGCVSADSELTGSGIGALRIGMAVEELVQQCPIAADTTVTDLEGQRQRVVLVGADSIRVEIVDEEVWRITVDEPTWRTEDSLGVGTPISELLTMPDVRGWTGEGNLVVVSPRHCGLSFQVERAGVEAPSGGEWDRAALARLPDTAKVELIRIVGCENFPR